jgi:hypothetical protein
LYLNENNIFKDISKELRSLNPLQLHSRIENNKTSYLNIFNAQRYANMKKLEDKYSRGPPVKASN